ncbi:MAG: hypothetical protein NTU83_12195 [Candidatus Hydrogenedentes bacterium]|nr:hypothetical protein [Candidatus Hydrogenedentota bacterium]
MSGLLAIGAIAALGATSSPESFVYKTSLPLVYSIDYATTHIDDPRYLDVIAEAPPDILHVGHDVVFKSHLGPCRGTGAFPASYELLSPDECESEMARVRQYVDSLHRVGAQTIIPYICDVVIFGDHVKRTGFWKFYDHWDDYESLGFGKKPETDPVAWMQKDERRPAGKNDMYVYAPCINNPDWQRYLQGVVRNIARCGYDGVFVDVNAFHCQKDCCRSLFAKYLEERYSRKSLKKLFGFDSAESVRIGGEAEGLLTVETYRFRAWSMARLFTMLRKEGEAIRPSFLLVPNLSPMANMDGVRERVGNGQDVGCWAQSCEWLMFEEMQQAGLFGVGAVSENTLQYKLAFANGIRGGMLLYHARDHDGISLAMAEAGAGGGGALIQSRYECQKVRKQYAAFWRDHPDLFEGLQPWSQVGVCYFRDELYWNNFDHLCAVYRIRSHLSDQHVLFDFIADEGLKLDRLRAYKAVVLPEIRHIDLKQIRALRSYVLSGGVLIAIGDCGGFDDFGRPRPYKPFDRWFGATKLERKIPIYSVGKGYCVVFDNLDACVPSPAFNLYDLSEDDANDIAVVMRRAQEAPGVPDGPSPLLDLIASLATEDITIGEPGVPRTVRASAFKKERGNSASLVLHLLNYNVPIRGEAQSGPPIVADQLAFDMPIPDGWRALSIEALEPGAKPESLPFTQADARIKLTVPQLAIYKIVHVRCERPTRK